MASIAGSKGGTNLQALNPAIDKQPWIADIVRPPTHELLIKAQEKIKKLESLLAGEIEEVSKLLKENTKLERKLEITQAALNAFKKYYKKLKGETEIRCDLISKAMITYGEIDNSEALHGVSESLYRD